MWLGIIYQVALSPLTPCTPSDAHDTGVVLQCLRLNSTPPLYTWNSVRLRIGDSSVLWFCFFVLKARVCFVTDANHFKTPTLHPSPPPPPPPAYSAYSGNDIVFGPKNTSWGLKQFIPRSGRATLGHPASFNL